MRVRREVLAAVLVAVPFPYMCERAQAQEVVTVGGSTTFTLPAGLVEVTGRPPPVARSWRNADSTLSIDTMTLARAAGDGAEAELQDWPGVGRSLAAGFGEASAKTYRDAFHAKCSYEGMPLERDLQRKAMLVRVDVTCVPVGSLAKKQREGGEAAVPVVIRTFVIELLTRAEQVIVRVDSRASTYSTAQAVAGKIWHTMKSAAGPTPSAEGSPPRPASMESGALDTAAPVTGGPGLRLTDYGLIRPARLVGEFVGALVAAIGFGALLCLGLMRIGIKPMPSVIVPQILLIVLHLWGDEHDGVWKLNWLVLFPTAMIAVFALRSWAQKRWNAKLRPAQALPPSEQAQTRVVQPIDPQPAQTASDSGRACRTCGARNSSDATFCGACGTKLVPTSIEPLCSKCGTQIPADGVYCERCGERVQLQPLGR